MENDDIITKLSSINARIALKKSIVSRVQDYTGKRKFSPDEINEAVIARREVFRLEQEKQYFETQLDERR